MRCWSQVTGESFHLDEEALTAVFLAPQNGIFAMGFSTEGCFRRFAAEFTAAEFENATDTPWNDHRLMESDELHDTLSW